MTSDLPRRLAWHIGAVMKHLICGNSLEIVQNFDDESIDAIIIDPPYGENMGYSGDSTITTAEALLVDFLNISYPKLKKNRHVAIFWTMRTVDIPIDAVRSCGFTFRRVLSMYLPSGNARPYLGWLPRTQAIIIAQKYLPMQPNQFHYSLAEYLSQRMDELKISKSVLARTLNCDSRLVMKWTRQNDPFWCLPTPRFYKPLKEILKLDDRFDVLLDRNHSNGKKFNYKHDTYIVDQRMEERWSHPSVKPLSVIEHIISCLTDENETILDGFMGSGTTGVACLNTNRKFIGIEIDQEYFDLATSRMEQRLI